MEVHKCLQVNIRNTIPILEVEVLAVKIRSYALEPSAGHGFRPRVNERHFPWLASILMNLHLILCDIKGHITCLEIVIREVAFDDIPAISAADHEIMHPVGGVDLHDMPKNGLPSDFNHRLWPEIALLTDPGAHASCKNHGLHVCSLPLRWQRSLLLRCLAF